MVDPLSFVSGVGQTFFRVSRSFAAFLREFYVIFVLIGKIFSRFPLVFKNFDLTLWQMFAIGITSIPLVSIISVFVGSVTVTQAVYEFSGIVPLRYLGLAVSKTLSTELVPVITSMVVSGRIATAIAAEIGSMKNTEQLDAMSILSLDPVRYLFVPKMIACIIMLPVLVIIAEGIAFVSSVVTVVLSVDVTLFSYLNGLRMYFNVWDVIIGILKTAVFGAIIALVGCHFGYHAKGGAEGVGVATTKSVMLASVLILVFDFIIAFMVLR
jgi:phospholipid/cholesterol/gamma-HCH transport system permease protein